MKKGCILLPIYISLNTATTIWKLRPQKPWQILLVPIAWFSSVNKNKIDLLVEKELYDSELTMKALESFGQLEKKSTSGGKTISTSSLSLSLCAQFLDWKVKEASEEESKKRRKSRRRRRRAGKSEPQSQQGCLEDQLHRVLRDERWWHPSLPLLLSYSPSSP